LLDKVSVRTLSMVSYELEDVGKRRKEEAMAGRRAGQSKPKTDRDRSSDDVVFDGTRQRGGHVINLSAMVMIGNVRCLNIGAGDQDLDVTTTHPSIWTYDTLTKVLFVFILCLLALILCAFLSKSNDKLHVNSQSNKSSNLSEQTV
ncbi:unnamed protein product, partial [Allacma fusca]